MSLNIGQVSAVPFKANAMDKVSSEQLSNPGLYSQPDSFGPPQLEEKKHKSLLGSLAKLTLELAVLGGVIIGARKLLFKGDIAQAPEGIMGKAKAYFQKTADFIEKYTIGFLKKKEGDAAKVATDAAEGATPAAGEAANTANVATQATPPVLKPTLESISGEIKALEKGKLTGEISTRIYNNIKTLPESKQPKAFAEFYAKVDQVKS